MTRSELITTDLFVLYLTGASGCGKTAILSVLPQVLKKLDVNYLHFDSIGVPSEAEMVKRYGSGRNWQEAMAILWAQDILYNYKSSGLVIIEGQVDIKFIQDSFNKLNFSNYRIILVCCERSVRDTRLRENRHQPHLANDDMENWAQYLKNQANQLNIPILDTTNKGIEESINWIINYLKKYKQIIV